jgi:hypothetical protein
MAAARLQWTTTARIGNGGSGDGQWQAVMGNGSSGDGQWQQCNGRQDGRPIVMGDETVAAQDDCGRCRSSAMGVWYFRLAFFFVNSQLGKVPPTCDFGYSFNFS